MRYLLALAVLASFTACFDDRLDRCEDDEVTLTQGVFGKLVGGCDTTGCSERLLADAEIAVFTAGHAEGAAPVAMATSNTRGMFVIEVPVGNYDVCIYTTSCVTIAITQNETRRYDFTSGVGGGQWEPSACDGE